MRLRKKKLGLEFRALQDFVSVPIQELSKKLRIWDENSSVTSGKMNFDESCEKKALGRTGKKSGKEGIDKVGEN